MIKTNFLYTPFPRPKNSRENIFRLLFISLICSCFIIIFRPYNIENQTGEFYLYLILFSLGLVFFTSVYVMEFLIPYFLKRIFEKWTLGKAILWYAWLTLFVGAIIFLYKSFLAGFIDFTMKEYFMVLGRVMSISITVSFFVLGMYAYLNKKQLSLLSAYESCLISSPDAKSIRLYLNEILFIESDDNYVDIHLIKNGKRSKEVFRSSLKNMEEQLVYAVSPIYKCHRQYLININYFNIQKKNSRSMMIKIKEEDDIIPVSKQYANQISELLQIRH